MPAAADVSVGDRVVVTSGKYDGKMGEIDTVTAKSCKLIIDGQPTAGYIALTSVKPVSSEQRTSSPLNDLSLLGVNLPALQTGKQKTLPKRSPRIPGFDPDDLMGSALLCIAHSDLYEEAKMGSFAVNSGSPVLTYTTPGFGLDAQDAQDTLKKIKREKRIPSHTAADDESTTGAFDIRPNYDYTPNYPIEGGREKYLGLYKVTPGESVEQLAHFDAKVKTNLRQLFDLKSKYKCNYIVLLACKRED